jgi:ABC-type enterochelin transport system permease subunit
MIIISTTALLGLVGFFGVVVFELINERRNKKQYSYTYRKPLWK